MSDPTKTETKPGLFTRAYRAVRSFVVETFNHYRSYTRPRGFFGTIKEIAHITVLHVARLVVYIGQSVVKGVKALYTKIVGLFKKAPVVATPAPVVVSA